MKKVIVIGLLFVVLLQVVGCGNQTTTTSQDQLISKEDELTVKIGHIVSDTHPYQDGLVKFGELLNEYTNGNVKIEIFPNNTLGNERELIEGLQLGTIEMALTSTSTISNFLPQMGVVDLPFLFRDEEHADKVLDGPIGTKLLEDMNELDIVSLCWWENGFRNLTNNVREVKVPDDIKGLKIRTTDNPVHIDIFNQLGASATPMAWPEVFTSLQNGALDGQENPITGIYANRVFEVQKYLSLTGHCYSPAILHVSKSTWDKFDDGLKEVIKKAAFEARDYERELNRKLCDEQIELLKKEGMIVNEIDYDAFFEAAKPVITKYEDKFGKDFIEEIINTK